MRFLVYTTSLSTYEPLPNPAVFSTYCTDWQFLAVNNFILSEILSSLGFCKMFSALFPPAGYFSLSPLLINYQLTYVYILQGPGVLSSNLLTAIYTPVQIILVLPLNYIWNLAKTKFPMLPS